MHQFCGRCGAKTVLSSDELCCLCTQCAATYFPRISPCVIGLVSRGDELLLAAHQRHKPGRYSLLAGFIEAGETAEEAFAREVLEEVGVRIGQVCYVASQPWPYPSQLMLGFFAEYLDGDITLDTREIQHAAWFHPSELPDIPSSVSIAGKLIRTFLAQRGYSLAF
jgi:NAD+ diphosphatase